MQAAAPDDPRPLAELARIAHDAGVQPPPRLAPEAMDQLLRYAFPGNVRELENLLHRAVTLSGGDLIHTADLGLGDWTAWH